MTVSNLGGFEKVVYIGATDDQIAFASCDDPRGTLVPDQVYGVIDIDVHEWFTRVKLLNVPGWFNSVFFDSAQIDYLEINNG